jgi:DNA-binding response OmpR family regulator
MISCGMDRTAAVEAAQTKRPPVADLQHFGGVVQVGDFRLDLSTRAASVRGTQLNLTDTEFDVLLFLTNHPTNVVTTSTTLVTNWGRQLRKAEFLQILLSLRRKIASAGYPTNYLSTESMVLCRFDPSGSKRP